MSTILQWSCFPTHDIDYRGKFIHDFHPKEYVRERLEMIARVIDEDKPLAIHHIYHGRSIHSTLWPIHDRKPPFNRVIVITKLHGQETSLLASRNVRDRFDGVHRSGELNILTPRELEVLVLLGHGMSVPKVAEFLHRSPKTVQRHKDSISKKLKVHSQAELVVIVTSIGLQLSDAKLKRFDRS
ncbi:MAG: helix-turn-helix transcriptional regulator [Pirellulaceae bacterium]